MCAVFKYILQCGERTHRKQGRRGRSHAWGVPTPAAPPSTQPAATPYPGLWRAPQRAAAALPERPGAKRSTALRAFGSSWTCASGWSRVAPQGTPEDGLGKGDVEKAGGHGGGACCIAATRT